MNSVLSMLTKLAERVDPFSKAGGKLGTASITNATGTTTVTITAANHGFQPGDIVYIVGVGTITNVNGTQTILTVPTANTFTFTPATAAAGTYSSGGTATSVCVTDGDAFTASRLLSIYNEARLALFSAIRRKYTVEELTRAISGAIIESQISFTDAGNKFTYSLPAGYCKAISLEGFSTYSKSIRPITILPATALPRLRAGDHHLSQSADSKSVVEMTNQLVHYGTNMSTQQLTGTGWAVTIGNKVVGTGTAFLSELSVGSQVFLDFTSDPSVIKTVESIQSNTLLTVSVPFTATSTGTTMRKILTGAGWAATATPVSTKTVVITGGAAVTELVAGRTVLLDAVEKVIDTVVADNTITVTEVFDAADTGTTVKMILSGSAWESSAVLGLETVVVTGGSLLTELKPGDSITLTLANATTVDKTVLEVESDTRFTITAAFAVPTTGTLIKKNCTGSAWAVTFDYSGLYSRGAHFTDELHILSAMKLVRLNDTIVSVTVASITDDENLILVQEFTDPADVGYAMSIALSGSVWTASATGPTRVVGTSTLFLSELNVGDTIRLFRGDGTYLDKIITSIETNTGLTVTVAFSGADDGSSISVGNYTLRYIGIADFTLANVYGGTTLETFNLDMEPKILDIAEKIVLEQGGKNLQLIADAIV